MLQSLDLIKYIITGLETARLEVVLRRLLHAGEDNVPVLCSNLG